MSNTPQIGAVDTVFVRELMQIVDDGVYDGHDTGLFGTFLSKPDCSEEVFCHTHLMALYASTKFPDVFGADTDVPPSVESVRSIAEWSALENRSALSTPEMEVI